MKIGHSELEDNRGQNPCPMKEAFAPEDKEECPPSLSQKLKVYSKF